MNTKTEVLKILKNNDDFVSGEEMSRLIGVSRAAVNTAVKALRADGFDISSSTNRGYRLMAMSDRLTEEGIGAYMDRDRMEGCRILAGDDGCSPDSIGHKADLIILDDAFQHRALDADFKIVLMDYGRPVYKDHLLPLGRLRDLPERTSKADIVIVTKCPSYIDEWRRDTIKRNIGFNGDVLFTTVGYQSPQPVFLEGDPRYVHSGWLILVTGIANATPLVRHLSDSYKIVKHISFGDHHRFSAGDIRAIEKAAEKYPAADLCSLFHRQPLERTMYFLRSLVPHGQRLLLALKAAAKRKTALIVGGDELRVGIIPDDTFGVIECDGSALPRDHAQSFAFSLFQD